MPKNSGAAAKPKTPAPGTTTQRRRLQGDDRRQALTEAAFSTLAERGFEGLRTREVAARAGVNIATLHYYYATKEALIAGVADSLLDSFRTEGKARAEQSAVARLQAELQGATQRMRRSPAIFTVLCELWLRAQRDASIGQVCRSLQDAWRDYLVGLLRCGLADGSLCAELEPVATADLIICLLHGVMAQQGVCKDLKHLDRACSQLLRLLLPSGNAKATGGVTPSAPLPRRGKKNEDRAHVRRARSTRSRTRD